MSRAGFFGSWKSQRYGFQLTFTRMFMACLFIAMMTFNAVMYVREDLRFELFGFENTWIYICIAAELVILALLGFLSVNSYSLYCLEEECLRKEAELKWLHQLDAEKAASLINEYRKDLRKTDLDDKTRNILDGMYRLVCQIYPYVTDTDNRLKSVENSVGSLSARIPASAFKPIGDMTDIVKTVHTLTSTVLANFVELENKIASIKPVTNYGVIKQDTTSIADEVRSLHSLVGSLERIREDFIKAMANVSPPVRKSDARAGDFLERLSTIETSLADVIYWVKDLQENQNKSHKLLSNTNDVLKSERDLMRQMADKICQNESIGSEIRELKALLDRKNMTVEEIKKLIKQIKDSRQSDSVEANLFKGQLSQLLDRTEILDTIRAVIHKYAYLIDVSKGDLVEFLKIDDVLSQPVQVLNISREIANALVRNGLDRIECLTMHDASVISQKTRLGPKRMQMLEEALKSYAPELGFGMYKI